MLPVTIVFNQLPFHRIRLPIDEQEPKYFGWAYVCDKFWANYFFEPDEDIEPLPGLAVSMSIPCEHPISADVVEAKLSSAMLSLHDAFVREFKARVIEHLKYARDWRD